MDGKELQEIEVTICKDGQVQIRSAGIQTLNEMQIQGIGNQNLNPDDIRISLGSGYEVGLRKINGQYEVVADWSFVRGVKQKEVTEKLMQRYAYQAVRTKLEQQGFDIVEEEVEYSGQIRILLRRMV